MEFYKIDDNWFPSYIKVVNRYTKYSFFLGTPIEYIVYEQAWFVTERISKLDDIIIIAPITESEYNKYLKQQIELNSRLHK